VAEGLTLVTELLASRIKVVELYGTQEFYRVCPLADRVSADACHVVTDSQLRKLSSLSEPNEVLAVCEIPSDTFEPSLLKNELCLVLDDIRDPGNLGTLIRVADWFGIPVILCSPGTVDTYNPKVVQATMGSIARVRVFTVDLVPLLAEVALTSPVYGAVLRASSVYTEELAPAGLLVLGNETRGISPEVQAVLTHKISIPSYARKAASAESLNAGVAGAVLCAEFRRRFPLPR
jgi:TrmH family RNA methyltransferase